MSFIFCDSKTGNIVDIVEDRRLHVLKNYFLQYTKAALRPVETIIIDMYSPYISLIKSIFSNAKIIIDKFYIVQLFSSALNKTRIKIMNQDKQIYNKLEKYWKLLLKDSSSVDYTQYSYHRSFKKQMRQVDILNYLLDLNSELKATYKLYQHIRYCIKHKDFKVLTSILSDVNSNISNYMKTSIKTIRKYIKFIENTLQYDYTNGIIEGINNKIKVIKRTAFVFRSFYHFKNRILITQNLAILKA